MTNLWVLGGYGWGTGIALPAHPPSYTTPGTPPLPHRWLHAARGVSGHCNMVVGSISSTNSLKRANSQGSEVLPRVIT